MHHHGHVTHTRIDLAGVRQTKDAPRQTVAFSERPSPLFVASGKYRAHAQLHGVLYDQPAGVPIGAVNEPLTRRGLDKRSRCVLVFLQQSVPGCLPIAAIRTNRSPTRTRHVSDPFSGV